MINGLFVISGTALTIVLSAEPFLLAPIGVICAFVVLCLLAFKHHILQIIFSRPINKKYIVFAVLFALIAVYFNAQRFFGKASVFITKLNKFIEVPRNYHNMLITLYDIGIYILVFTALFALCGYFYWLFNHFTPVVKNFFHELEKPEKVFLLIVSTAAIIAIPIIFSKTNVFYDARFQGEPIKYDVIYTTDTIDLVNTNVHLDVNAPENDIRQPLFGVFSMPFAIFAVIVSKALFFVPCAYTLVITIIQIILLQITMILFARMLALPPICKILFLTALVFSYPVLLFSLVIEQYIFAVFWLILLVYAYLYKKQNREYYFIAAAGSLLTSGVLFPLLSYAKKSKAWFKDIFHGFIKFAVFIILSGQLPVFLNYSHVNFLFQFSGIHVTFPDRLLQYIHFIALCFFRPLNIEISTETYASYRLAPVTAIHIPGLVLLAAALTGFILNRKKPLAQICAGWIVFSFIVLCAVGWGTAENGLILYTLYFSWAFLALVYMAIEKICSRIQPLKFFLYILIIAILAIINLPGIGRIISFGRQYYPAGM